MIKQLDLSYLPEILKLLDDHGLPVKDIDLTHQKFWGLFHEGQMTGIGALEIKGDFALLRSLAIQQKYQNKGYGNQVLNTLLAASGRMGIKQLYLLTETASPFFLRNNFIKIDRNMVPKEILDTEEFKSICPSTAICMTYNIKS
ncbi:arsenic resistance N-acetyltransferase ArsN2 [Fulvivirga sp.]|uniref:arsenic resistance N-acetyltransferase ArsN2 n=1 Tax=Fulvivirga sp. TaxID=1931237 RepID=UPI0032EDC7F3